VEHQSPGRPGRPPSRAAPARRPRRVYGEGGEPDPRFTLANERTYLAWIRTALALTAAGVALDAVALDLDGRLHVTVSLVLVVLGASVPLQAWRGWARTERALRREEPLPSPAWAPVLAVGITAAGFALAVGIVLA
jgi:putative membrane protein